MMPTMLIAISAAVLCFQTPDSATPVAPPAKTSRPVAATDEAQPLGTLEVLELGHGRQLQGHVLRATTTNPCLQHVRARLT